MTLDACHALMNYGVDKYKKPIKLSTKEEGERLQKKLEDDRILLNDLWRTIPKDEKEKLKVLLLKYYQEYQNQNLKVHAVGLQHYSRKSLTQQLVQILNRNS